jgi:diacylglycerol kinase
VNVCVESFLDLVFSAEIHPKSEEAKDISVIADKEL